MPLTQPRPRGRRREDLRPRRALLLAVVAAAALAGCGGDDDEGDTAADTSADQEQVAQLEERLRESINGETVGQENPAKRQVEEVSCPDDVDLSKEAVGEEYVCEASGNGETSEIGVVVIEEETFNYGGNFGGTGEFGQGITLTPPEKLPDKGQGGGGSGGGGSGGQGG
jgi:hypothetical protein